MGGPEGMQDLGPDMDDLLRRAAEGYPLRDPADDWDKIASRLPEASLSTPAGGRAPGRGGRKRWLWLLLLLIPAGAAMVMIEKNNTAPGEKSISVPVAVENKLPPGLKSENNASSNKPNQSETPEHNQTPEIDDRNNSNFPTPHHPNATIQTDKNVSEVRLQYPDDKANTNSYYPVRNSSHKSSLYIAGTLQQFNYDDDLFNESASLKKLSILQSGFATNYYPNAGETGRLNIDQKTIAHSTDSIQATINPRSSYFYYGLKAGAGFSSVKHNGMQRLGYEGGLIAGYSFNKTFSLETGLLVTQRYYTTNGDDFNTDKLGGMMQPGMKMMEVEGSTQALSIPVHIKLDIAPKKQHRFFVKTGVSSLVLMKEQNYYHTMMNGNPDMIKGVYKNKKNYLAATVDFAAGYEQKINNRFYLRVEPFIQIPVRQVGIGNIPVTTTGLHVGLSWPAH